MSWIIDLIFVAVLGLAVFLGWRRGFAESVLRSGRLILAFVITLAGGRAFSALLDRRWIYPAVYHRIHPTFMDMADAAEGRVDALVAKIPASFRPFLELDATEPGDDLLGLAEEWAGTVAHGISGAISSLAGHILLFILSFLLLTVAILLVRGITRLPVIRTVDRLLGLALGVVSGLLLTVFLAELAGSLLSVLGQGELVEHSLILRLFH